MDESQRKDMQAGLFRDMILIFQKSGEDVLTVQAIEGLDVNGTMTEGILVQDPAGNSIKLYLDPGTHMIIKREYQGTTMMGVASMEEFLSNYKDVNGIMVPFHLDVKANGEPYIGVDLQEVQFNTEVDPALFER